MTLRTLAIGLLLAWAHQVTPLKRVRTSAMGPFETKFIRSEECSNKDPSKYVLTRLPTRAYKFNQTTILYKVNLTLQRDLNDDFTTRVDFSVWGNGGWRPNFYKVAIPGGCQKAMEFEWKLLASFFNQNLTCPIKKGTVISMNYNTAELTAQNTIHLTNAPYGLYKAELSIKFDNGDIGTCLAYILDVKPKS